MKNILVLLIVAGCFIVQPAIAQSPDQLNDLEMAHVAVTASNIDISYAHLALAFSKNPSVREFADTMIRDHSAVNQAIVDLANKLGVTAQDNAMSSSLQAGAETFKSELVLLRGHDFDQKYVENELAYHITVNGAVRDAFIPNIENDEVKAAFTGALKVFEGHEQHAAKLVKTIQMKQSAK